MKDRFKFRVWDKENFNYLEFEGFKKGEIEFNFDIDTNSIWIEFDHNKYILEQCTGLKDKNGKLIYEGDIVRDEHSEAVAIIEWLSYAYSLMAHIRGMDDYVPLEDICYACEASTPFEVIGNIYEDSHLIENSNNLC